MQHDSMYAELRPVTSLLEMRFHQVSFSHANKLTDAIAPIPCRVRGDGDQSRVPGVEKYRSDRTTMLDARNIVTRRYSRHTAQDNYVCVGQERVNLRT